MKAIVMANDSSLCGTITDYYTKDYCYNYTAQQTRTPALCSQIDNEGMEMQCLMELASALNDSGVCLQAKGWYNSECITAMAVRLGNLNLCGQAADSKSNDAEEYRNNCRTALAIAQKNVSICFSLNSWYANDSCIVEVAVSEKNATMCSLPHAPGSQDFCRQQIS